MLKNNALKTPELNKNKKNDTIVNHAMVTRSLANKSGSNSVVKTIIQAFENLELITIDSIIVEGSARPLSLTSSPNGCGITLGVLPDPFSSDVINTTQRLNPICNILNEIEHNSDIYIIPATKEDPSLLYSQVPCTLSKDLSLPHIETQMDLVSEEDGEDPPEVLAKKPGHPSGSKNKGHPATK